MLFSKKIKEQNQSLISENAKLTEKIKLLEEQNASLTLKNEQLCEQNQKLTAENQRLTNEFKPFLNAKKQAEDYKEHLEENAVMQYNLQFERLEAFIQRWQANLPESKADSPENKKRLALTKLLSGILQENTPVSDLQAGAFTVERLNEVIGGKNIDGENAFDLDAVLNPSADLDLASLCKELGVMD